MELDDSGHFPNKKSNKPVHKVVALLWIGCQKEIAKVWTHSPSSPSKSKES